jgi:OH-DDVA oxygenase/3-O-methylgallate 3,4-dioxygenase
VPVYQNTCFPPNQSTAKRSYRFGQVIKEAIESWPLEKRVAVFASGGMSHFVIDEEFDRKFVGALKSRDKDYLTSIPLKHLQSGTSELKSWISCSRAPVPRCTRSTMYPVIVRPPVPARRMDSIGGT